MGMQIAAENIPIPKIEPVPKRAIYVRPSQKEWTEPSVSMISADEPAKPCIKPTAKDLYGKLSMWS
tara:strand:- start:2211 stop:2408 length:198 start_codon:yes stop_codon:yes gene_type:complete